MTTPPETHRATNTEGIGASARPRTIPFGPILILVVALVMGLPTLRGGFVWRDDRQLVLNHVFVNHPSIEHTLKLFTIVHRDLYQPIPMVTFAAEFALAQVLGLLREGIEPAQWLFHLTNVLLHAVNSVLVWLLIVTWAPGRTDARAHHAGIRDTCESIPIVAVVAALLFAVHPLQVEVVAWINGRMMLLSTMFALASLIALGRWVARPNALSAVGVVVFALACGLSKVRIALPVLMVLLLFGRSVRPTKRLVVLWLLVVVETAVLVGVNVLATSRAGLFEGAAEQLQGSRLARTAVSLAWYIQHFVVPTGLAAWYPAPQSVALSDPWVVRSLLLLTPISLLAAWGMRRSRVVVVGCVWFLATLAATLPLVPSRGTLVADRYMYLPIIGLLWMFAVLAARLHGGACRRWRAGWLVPAAVAVLSVAAIFQSHAIARTYESYLAKNLRIARLFPDEPHVWERVAWAYVDLGEFDRAIEIARKEFVHDDVRLASETHSLIGTAHLRAGRVEQGLASLRLAVEVDPENDLARYRLGAALDDLGRIEDALPQLERAVANMPNFNPGLCRLAQAYIHTGRHDEAQALVEQALQNNRYDVNAILVLAQIEMETSEEGLRRAENRLRDLITWMPENSEAHTNLGSVLARIGRRNEAAAAYGRALDLNRSNATAAINLGQLELAAGRADRARALFELAAQHVEIFEQALAVHEYFVTNAAPAVTVPLWQGYIERVGTRAEAQSMLAWSYALAGSCDFADQALRTAGNDARSVEPGAEDVYWLHAATRALCHLGRQQYKDAAQQVELVTGGKAAASDAVRRLTRALGLYGLRNPNDPWPLCFSARLLLAQDRVEDAEGLATLCLEQCEGTGCGEYARAVLAMISASRSRTGGRYQELP